MSSIPPKLKLTTTQLPTLPPGLNYLLTAFGNDQLDHIQLAEIIEKFPSIASRLLTLANSAWSSPKVPVTSIPMACSRLGVNVVRSVSLALAVATPFNPQKCQAFDAKRFWFTALATADSAYELAKRIPNLDIQTVRTAGLLHNIGLLLLADQLPEQTHQALASEKTAAKSKTAEKTNQVIKRYCGLGYDEAGQLLALQWNFPASLIDSIGSHLTPNLNSEHKEVVFSVSVAAKMVHDLQLKQDFNAEAGEKECCIPATELNQIYTDLHTNFARTEQLAQELLA